MQTDVPESQPETTKQDLSIAADMLVEALAHLDDMQTCFLEALHAIARANAALQDGVRPIIEEEPGAVPE